MSDTNQTGMLLPSNPKPVGNKDTEDQLDVDEIDDALYDKDRTQLLQIFPDEVWCLITDAKNINSTNLTSLSNSSPYFRKLLWRKRVLFLFPKVWNQLWASWPISINFDAEVCEEVLPIRLICKTWCKTIDTFQEKLHSQYKFLRDDTQTTRDEIYRRSTVSKFAQISPETLERFLGHFESTHIKDGESINPFMGRALKIAHHNARDFHRSLNAVLSVYGKHVLYCTLSSGAGVFPPKMFYMKFRQYLELMPNLKSFKIHHEGRDNYAVTTQLVEIIRKHPLSILPKLEFFSGFHIPEPIFNQFMAQHNGIKYLEVAPGPSVSINQNHIQFPEMNNLEKLSLKCYELEDYQLLQTKLSSCKLQTLHLDLEACQYVEWSGVFTVLETNWGETLTDLILSFPQAASKTDKNKILTEYSLCPLKLPLVSRLKLLFRNVCCLDFILPMQKNLEFLYVGVFWDTKDAKNQVMSKQGQQLQKIEFLGGFEEFNQPSKFVSDANIWTLFPKLVRFDIWDLFWHNGMDTSLKGQNIKYRGATREEWRNHNQK